MFFEKPFLGIGTDQFSHQYGQYTTLSDMKLVDNAHSIPLQILTTQGLIGIFFMLTFAFWVLLLKRNESNSSLPEWSFWQAIFFSYVFIGIIGIDHPAIISLAFLAAGVLSGLSSRPGQANRSISIPSKLLYLSITAFGLVLLVLTFNFGKVEFSVATAIDNLSKGVISEDEFHRKIQQELPNLHNSKLSLVVGDAYIALDRKTDALAVANFMISRFPDDQRSGRLFFEISKKWSDQESLDLAEKQRDRLFPNAS
jgi:hypothetical protein